MLGPGSVIFRWVFRIGLYAVLGWLGVTALAFPLFGYLSYIGALIVPLVCALAFVAAVLAITGHGRWTWAYLLGNTGVLAATGVVIVASLVALWANVQVDTEVTRPLYLAIVLLGFVAGVVAGVRMRQQAP